MKARLKGIYSVDLPNGSPQMPTDPSDCWIVVEANIGEDDRPGADTFTFYVTTPTFLERAPQAGLPHMIVLDRFNWQEVENNLLTRCSQARGKIWAELARSIGGEWEFDNYKPAEGDV
jgi:hypothetical protein